MSQDFGLKISLPGVDIKTATPEQCSVHSSYDTMKVKLDSNNPQFGNILVTFADNPQTGTFPIYTIHHGYGYIPAFYLYSSTRDSSHSLQSEFGNKFFLNAGNLSYFQAVPDAQNIVFSYIANHDTENTTGEFFAFRFYVFANDGI